MTRNTNQNNPTCLITGAGGFVGGYLAGALAGSDWKIFAARFKRELHPDIRERIHSEHIYDLGNASDAKNLLRETRPEIVIHAAAEANPAVCDADPERALRSNVVVTENLLHAAELYGCRRFIYLSTDMVFDGAECPSGGFSETDQPVPVSAYSRSKYQSERTVLGSTLDVVILRLALTYGPGIRNFLGWVRTRLADDPSISLYVDEYRCPLFVGDLVRVVKELPQDDAERLYHVAGPERSNRVDFGARACEVFGFDAQKIVSISRNDHAASLHRSADLSMNCGRLGRLLGEPLSDIRTGLLRTFAEDSWW